MVAKVTISLPEELLAQVDAAASAAGQKRSPWIAQTLGAALDPPKDTGTVLGPVPVARRPAPRRAPVIDRVREAGAKVDWREFS